MNLRRKSKKILQGTVPKQGIKRNKKLKEFIDLSFKTVVITGTIKGMTRGQAQEYLRSKHPFILFKNSVSNTTDYLIAGYGIGHNKIEQASKWNIPIINASELF